ncbi:hypothetical protein NLG97_g10161 [Lecanicillium saksenae]|uniref:Uncharacterized protein n=1 Tax=Lecanicillium saksenae TaxID=468837 RepID=A0ACC1QFS6_9HYPO|nr:hypothetical protein NLG97_g10161 [Lecanicillium saksenae]
MPWHAEDLVEEGIFYFREVAKDGDLPPHVEHLRKSLLDFSRPMTSYSWTANDIADHITAGEPHIYPLPLFKSTKDIRDEAVRLSHGDFAEEKWSDFYKKELFDRLASCTISSDGNSRISVRSHFYYDAIVSETNELWEVFNKRWPGLPKPISCPKPDIAFFLPIYDTTEGLPVTKSVAFANKSWQQIPGAFMAEPFTWSTLSELNAHAVELKRNGEDPIGSTPEETVCCQANNAATCALRLQRQLAKHATPLTHQAHVQPIPTITTIGPHVTAWIAYYAEGFTFGEVFSHALGRNTQDEAYIMRAIWTGNMTVVKDVIEFNMLLDNIYTWAMRVFKPNVAFYLNQWKHVCSQKDKPSSTPHLQSRLEEFRATVPMVNALWNEYKEMEFETMADQHWMSPVHFGLILQQLVMSDHEKLLEKVGKVMDDKLQILRSSQNPNESAHSSAGGRARAPSVAIRTRPRDSYDDSSSDEASNRYRPGSDDDEVGTQTTRASCAASDPDGLRRSTRLNRSTAALAPEIHVVDIPLANELVTPNNRSTTSSDFSSITRTATPSSLYDTGTSARESSSESAAMGRTPTASVPSPTPSRRIAKRRASAVGGLSNSKASRSASSDKPLPPRTFGGAIFFNDEFWKMNTPGVIPSNSTSSAEPRLHGFSDTSTVPVFGGHSNPSTPIKRRQGKPGIRTSPLPANQPPAGETTGQTPTL